MTEFVIIEIGSTNTKAYLYDNGQIKDLGSITIEFKNHYKIEQKISPQDKKTLFQFIEKVRTTKTYVYGTSIFRNLPPNKKQEWLQEFKDKTNIDFKIVTADMENELTVYGAISNINYPGTIAVMIGGGGSTELAIVKKGKIIEKANYSFGALDITDMYPELKMDYAKTNYNVMLEATKKLVTIPQNKADILILAGGDYLYYYKELEYPLEKNIFYDNILQPYCLDVQTMHKLDQKFFYKQSLKEICKRTNNDGWWRGARGMRLCVKALVDILETKYIIPTKISMVYGIVENIKKQEKIRK